MPVSRGVVGFGFLVLVAAGACNSSNYDYDPPSQEQRIPTAQRDFGPIVKATHTPPPISGGTLLLTADGARAVASDPDRDRVYVVDLAAKKVLHDLALQRDDEPGRLIEDGAGRVHVALRRGGAIVTIDPVGGKLLARRPVCAAPRGIAWEADGDRLHVACAQGELHTIPAFGDGPERVLTIGDDLRDVVVQDKNLVLSRFRSGAVVAIDHDGNKLSETHLQPVGSSPAAIFDPAVAWRMRAMPKQKRVVVLHQRGGATPVSTGAGGYSSGSPCGGSIVHGAMASVGPAGDLAQTPQIPGAVLPVDFAISSDESKVAVVSAGSWKGGDPRVVLFAGKVVMPPSGGSSTGAAKPLDCLTIEPIRAHLTGQAIAVAFDKKDELIVQMREPAQLVIGTSTVSLSSESVEDTGHTIFHVAASVMSPIACASCHPEGGDDGRTWVFKGLGRRRTQTLRGGITQTAPFHWSGDEKDIGALMNDVFAKRMQGGTLSAPQVAALAGWLDTVPALPKIAPTDAAAAARGKVLYEGEAECASCHVGHLLTNRQTVDVGTGAPFQVPVLAGIRFRAPYMHDGCAKTLLDRFGACGGGDAHGKTSQLSKAQVADLVAYLETL